MSFVMNQKASRRLACGSVTALIGLSFAAMVGIGAASACGQHSGLTLAPIELSKNRDDSRLKFLWPAQGRLVFRCWAQSVDHISIATKRGAPVRAVEAGVVAYAGVDLKAYDAVILIRHTGGFVSAYVGVGDFKVKRGDHVARGQIISSMADRGDGSSPELVFALRRGGATVDPLRYLKRA
jgi:septal ring factor EnvC (AmiA/AmiB activator)